MLNVIFTANEVAIRGLSASEEAMAPLIALSIQWVSAIPECRVVSGNLPIQAYVKSIEDFFTIKTMLEQVSAIQVVGIWNSDGAQYGYKRIDLTEYNEDTGANEVIGYEYAHDTDEYGNPILSPATFNLPLYMELLADKVAYTDEGVEVSRERPVVPIQINLWSGQPNRDLTEY